MDIKKDINNIHDKSYKDLLSDKEIFIDLISNFIDTKWAKSINPQNLALVNKSFILADYEELESDIVYKVRYDETEIYFYILLELQSSVDYSMPMRLYFYISEIYREIIRNTTKKSIKRKRAMSLKGDEFLIADNKYWSSEELVNSSYFPGIPVGTIKRLTGKIIGKILK